MFCIYRSLLPALVGLLLTCAALDADAADAADAADSADSAVLNMKPQRRVKVVGTPDSFRVIQDHQQWNAAKTAIIIVDMWDSHHCLSAARRVDEMAPHVNDTINVARDRGAFIIHAPSDCMKYYKDAPQRRRAIDAPLARSKVTFQWNYFDAKHEGPLAERLEKGGCSCDTLKPCSQSRIVWEKQNDAIKIHLEDAITADGQEVLNLLQQRGIDNVVILGVHTNRCVLGRPFGIRQMTYLKKNVVLCRDLTDSYHRDPGHHFEGLNQIIEHVEKYWCPTITSENITGQPPFRFKQAQK
ncbi:MAG: nicotinamidase-related amidase [Pirellulaceae bacterium]|jgi:nicotinamidase-related amidase